MMIFIDIVLFLTFIAGMLFAVFFPRIPNLLKAGIYKLLDKEPCAHGEHESPQEKRFRD